MKKTGYVCLAYVAFGASLLAESGAARHFELYQQLLARGRRQDAKQELLVAIQIDPNNSEYQAALAASNGQPSPSPVANASLVPAQGGERGSLAYQQKIASSLQEASQAYRDSQLEAARQAWERVQILDPGNTEAARGLLRLSEEAYHSDHDQPFDGTVAGLYEAAMRDVRKNHFAEAQAKLNQALNLNATQPQVKKLLMEIQENAQMQDSSHQADELCEKGEGLIAQGRLSEAKTLFDRVLQLEPDSQRAKKHLAALEKALKPKYQEAFSKAELFQKNSQFEKAAYFYRQALDILPGESKASLALQHCQEILNKEEAKRGKQEAIKKDYNLGVEAFQNGSYVAAKKFFESVLELDPSDKDAARALHKAQDKLAELEKGEKGDVKRWLLQAKEEEEKGALEAALGDYDKVLFHEPENALAKEGKARLSQQLAK